MAQAGSFLLAVGDVVVVRGTSEIRAELGTQVQSGDTIRVGAASNAQVRMSDESIVGLRSGSVFRIDEYAFSGKSDGSEKSLFSLLKGGMRTITGLIGRTHSIQRYAVRTQTATIGIRGTHYTLVECANDCAPGVQNGTYGGVTDGRIGVQNQSGERQFGANEFFHVADANAVPQSLIAPPPFLFDRLEGQQRSSGQKGNETSANMAQSGLNAESRPSDVPAAPAPEPFVVTEKKNEEGTPEVVPPPPPPPVVTTPAKKFDGAYPTGTNLGFMSAEFQPSSGSHNAHNAIGSGTSITVDAAGITAVKSGGSPAYDRGTAKSMNYGADSGVIAWDRWADGQAVLYGWGNQTLTAEQGFHIIVGDPTVSLPLEGTFTYGLIGATTPTEARSGAQSGWSVTGGSLNVNFTTASLTGNMGLGLNRSTDQGSFNMALSGSATNFASLTTSVTKTGGSTTLCATACAGSGTVMFAGTQASHAGVIYEFNTGSYAVQGAAAFKR
jgi:hypothetical protein